MTIYPLGIKLDIEQIDDRILVLTSKNLCTIWVDGNQVYKRKI